MIGREAIRRSLWALDGMAPLTPLAEAVLDRFERRADEVVDLGRQRAARPTTRSFAPLVLDHAEKRDPLAIAIVAEAAADVARIDPRGCSMSARRRSA